MTGLRNGIVNAQRKLPRHIQVQIRLLCRINSANEFKGGLSLDMVSSSATIDVKTSAVEQRYSETSELRD
jgi:hypothetical protein